MTTPRSDPKSHFEAVLLFLGYLFRQFPLRKVCAEMLSFNYADVASGAGRFFNVDGIMKEHEYYDGQYWDMYILSVTRAQWTQIAMRFPQWVGPFRIDTVGHQ